MTPTPEQVREVIRNAPPPEVAVTIHEAGLQRIAVLKCRCGNTHYHGAGLKTEGPVEEFLGHRLAHCKHPAFFPKGYVLVLGTAPLR